MREAFTVEPIDPGALRTRVDAVRDFLDDVLKNPSSVFIGRAAQSYRAEYLNLSNGLATSKSQEHLLSKVEAVICDWELRVHLWKKAQEPSDKQKIKKNLSLIRT